MNEWTGHTVSRLHVDGGAAANDFLLQFQSDILRTPIARSRFTHSALAGGAYLAGLQAGLWSSREEINALCPLDRHFEPKLDEQNRQRLYAGWKRVVRALLHLYAEAEADEPLEPGTE
jgi:glycerol kinase